MEDLVLRYSKVEDAEVVNSLICACFGDRSHMGILEDLDGRYLLAVKDNRVVGMSGISENKDYCGLEVDWTCVLPNHRKQGIVTMLLVELLSRERERGYKGNIYYSAWSTWDKPGSKRMDGILSKLGFKRVVNNEFNWVNGHNCTYTCKQQCIHYWSGCNCKQDLWAYNMV